MIETNKLEERVILVAVATQGDDTQESLEELEELMQTAGAVVVGQVVQNRENMHPGTYIGKGKMEEVADLLYSLDATGIVCDDELSPAQLRNLQEALDTKVMDRTLVILDIFAGRATTSEGKLQVELAQLRYRSARLSGLGTSMSRLGGGIGTRGPGEKKLESDRRLIKSRIAQLNRELKELEQHRDVQRAQRERNQIPVVAIVGYTNAGKSTLLNNLTGANVLEEDKLFATLDPTTRLLDLPSGQQILLTDTVGFIRKLPHHLIQAFKSTLEEAKYADFILHVVDASNPQMDHQMLVVYDTLTQLDIKDKKVITLFNKQDQITEKETLRDRKADYILNISAKYQEGFEQLTDLLEQILRERNIYIERIIPYDKAGIIQQIRKYGQLLFEEYQDDGIAVKAYVPLDLYGKIE